MTARRPYVRTGLHALRARVKVAGLSAIDRRTSAARALLDSRRDLIADLGGEDAVTAQQRALVESVTRRKLYLDHLDGWLLSQTRLIDHRKKSAYPVLLQREQIAAGLARDLLALGLERKAKPVMTLDAYIKAKYAAPANGATTGERTTREPVTLDEDGSPSAEDDE